MSDQQTPENQPSAAAEPNPTTDATPEPSFGPGSDHFRRLAEVEKQKREAQEREKSLSTKYQQMEELVRLAASDYDRFQAVMGKPKAPAAKQEDPAAVALKEVETLKRAIEQREAEEAKQLEQAQLSEAKSKITEYVSTQKEKYPLVVALGFEEAVADMVHQAFLNGQVLSEDQAAGEIEKRLASRSEQLKQLYAAQTQATQEAPKEKQKVPTLSRTMQSESPTKSDPSKFYSTREDRLEAIARDLRAKFST